MTETDYKVTPREKLRAALDKLDSPAPYLVARKLRRRGIKGTHSAGRCPVARYLQAETGMEDIRVGATAVHSRGETAASQWYVTVRLPESVVKFIAQFDAIQDPELNGQYSDLEEKGDE